MSWIEDPGVEMFQGLNLTSLDIDEAYVRFNNNGTSSAWFYSLSDDCYNCPYTRVSVIEPPNQVIVVDTTHSQYWRVTSKNIGVNLPQDDKSNVICDIAPDIGEFGVYSVNVKEDSCDFNVEKEPVNIYLPLLILFFIILGMVLVWKLIPIIIRRFFLKKKVEDLKKEPVRKRVKSLDTFRGLSIVLMIFVNSGAGRYWWLEHATWNGLTVGDLVFPWFLWIMGVCIPMSVRSIVVKDLSKVEALLNIFRRSCILFLLGIALGSIFGPLLDNMRIFGVLQRFGVSYWIVASIMVILGKKRDTPDGKWMKMFWDITEIGLQWIIMLILILVHVIVIFYAPMPDCPTGYLGAGGKQDNWANPWCIGGITMYIDVSVLGSSHLYQNPTAKHVYESGAFDPEGIFGCLLSIVHVFLGVQAGNTLQHHKKWKPLIIRWLIWAAVLGLIGGILCNFSKHDGVIPVNKNLWSLSFMLITCSFAFIVLSIFYMLIDVWELWNGSPFLQPGMNSITMYVGHSICYAMFPFHWNIPNMRTHFVFLMENAWATFLWVLLSCEMARNNFYLSI